MKKKPNREQINCMRELKEKVENGRQIMGLRAEENDNHSPIKKEKNIYGILKVRKELNGADKSETELS